MVALLAAATPARAQPRGAQTREAPADDAKRVASAHFNRGAELFQEGVYRAALVELKRAYEIAPNYRVLYNIGQTHVALGEFVEGIGAFEAFLSQGGTSIEAARRGGVQEQIAQLKKRTALLDIQVNRAGARVSIDGQLVGESPLPASVPVNVGQHRIDAVTDGAAASEEVDVAGGDVKQVRLTLVEAPVSVVTPMLPAAAPVPDRKLSKRRRWAIGLLSACGALALGGGALALVARSARDDHDQELSSRPGDPVAIHAARDKLSRAALSADVLWGGALATGVSGIVLLVMRDPAERAASPRVQLGLSPSGLLAKGRF